ncbi:MAG: hypothetical protein ACSHX8_07205 [Opitutaceae bacterium]
MKNYTITADNRRPLKFSGVKLGSNDDSSISEISNELAQVNADWFTRLTLYKTEGGKIVLHSEKIFSARVTQYPQVKDSASSLEVHDSVEAYLASALNKKGEYGRATCALMNNVADNNPELEEHWAESID